MESTREALTAHLAERWCWQVARRDDAWVARRLSRQPGVDGVYQLDEGALLDDFCAVLPELGGGDGLGEVQGTAVQRAMVPVVHDGLLDSLKPLLGIESMPALPTWLFSDEARMRLGGARRTKCGAACANGGRRHARGHAPEGPSARMPWPIRACR